MRRLLALAVVGCGSSPPPPAPPVAPVDPPVDAALPLDADVSDAVTSAPAWVFRYNAAGRLETWTLRHADGAALLVVESAAGTARYVGTISDGPTRSLAVATASAKLALACKPAKQPISATCGDRKAKAVDVLDCYHPDFQTPMTFALAPGAEYVQTATCSGYRLLP